MKITNRQLINELQPGLNALAVLRTGPKIAYNVAYSLKKIVPLIEAFMEIYNPLNDETPKDEKALIELFNIEIDVELRPITSVNLSEIKDIDLLTPAIVFLLGDFIID